MKQHWKDVLGLGVVILIVFIFFYKTFLYGFLPIPTDSLVGLYHPWRDYFAASYPRGVPFKNFLITDPVRQQIPWRKLSVDLIKSGKLPLWNSYSFSGTPLLANIQAGAFYIWNILFFMFDFASAWTILIILEPLLSGIFLYLYLRHLNLNQYASLFGAVTWSFSGFSMAWLTWGTMVHVALWLPLILFSIDKIIEVPPQKGKESLLWFYVFVFSLIFEFFAGHVQISLYIIALGISYACFRIYSHAHRAHVSVKRAWVIVVGVLLAIVITSIQWVPLVGFIKETSRLSQADGWLQNGWFLPWQHLIQFAIPDFFGNPATLNYWGVWNYGEFIGYIGIIPLIFSLSVIFSPSKDRRNYFFSTVLFFCLVFMLSSPIAKLPFLLHVPVLSSLQPTRLMVIVDFCLSVLAALGVQRWLDTKGSKQLGLVVGLLVFLFVCVWALILLGGHIFVSHELLAHLAISKRNLIIPTVLLGIAVLALSLASRLGKKKYLTCIFIILFAITSFDLLRTAWKFTPFTPRAYFFPTTSVINFLKSQPGQFRVITLNSEILPPNTADYYGIESIDGYDPLYFSRYEEFIAALSRGKPNIDPPFGFNRIITPHEITSPLLPLLNIKYILSLAELPTTTGVKKVFQEGDTRIYENRNVLPRIYPVEGVKYAREKQKVIDMLYDHSYQPQQTAIVEEPINIVSLPIMIGESVVTGAHNPSEAYFSTRLINTHFIFIGNIYDDRWLATIDGVKTKIYRADYVFQGIVAPPGTHRIHLYYSL